MKLPSRRNTASSHLAICKPSLHPLHHPMFPPGLPWSWPLMQVYKNTRATLAKLLNVGSKASARDLCIQFGCARHEATVKASLAAYKERFVRRLPAAQQVWPC